MKDFRASRFPSARGGVAVLALCAAGIVMPPLVSAELSCGGALAQPQSGGSGGRGGGGGLGGQGGNHGDSSHHDGGHDGTHDDTQGGGNHQQRAGQGDGSGEGRGRPGKAGQRHWRTAGLGTGRDC